MNVLATTTIVGDVVSNIGGEAIDLQVLLPVGVDPHSFQPAPQDIAKAVHADVIFMNGAGLEEFMQSLLEKAGGDAKLISVSDGIPLLAAPPGEEEEGFDPHVWMDPNHVMIWVDNIQRALTSLDAQNAAVYQANAERYRKELTELDRWVRGQVEQIPEANRILVTDHVALGYFAARYGFQQVGSIIPGLSTLAEPSAQELATLEDIIRAQGVKAIFVGNTVNPALAERVAEDTGVQLVYFYTGSLTGKDGPASTYLEFMRYNVTAITNALKK